MDFKNLLLLVDCSKCLFLMGLHTQSEDENESDSNRSQGKTHGELVSQKADDRLLRGIMTIGSKVNSSMTELRDPFGEPI